MYEVVLSLKHYFEKVSNYKVSSLHDATGSDVAAQTDERARHRGIYVTTFSSEQITDGSGRK